MSCTTISINLGASFFWVLTCVISVTTAMFTWQIARIYHDRQEAQRFERENTRFAAETAEVGGRERAQVYRIDPRIALMQLPRPIDKATPRPEKLPGWRKLGDQEGEDWYAVAAE
jgi:hypothetical protein